MRTIISRKSILILFRGFRLPCMMVLVNTFFATYAIAQTPKVLISKLPGWVDQISPDYTAVDTTGASGGYYYLMIDRQEHVPKEQKYRHFALKVLNAEGIQDASNISFDFDPEYETVELHSINVVRNGVAINRLRKAEFKVLHREKNLERALYDGRFTAVANLEDIRIGDIIEYEYSYIGYNPVYKMFSQDVYHAYNVPVSKLRERLLFDPNTKLKFKYYNEAKKPVTSQSNGLREYSWEFEKTRPVRYDVNTPSWHNAYQYVSISEFGSWARVAQWSNELYFVSQNEKDKIREKVLDLIDASDIDKSILMCIRFCQDEIRYLGFEDGLNSHVPEGPVKVWDQRYGDCKAKSFLLSEMLKSIGIDASPILVHSRNGQSLPDMLATPKAFDHCVVQLIKDGEKHFIDPTISDQGSDLERYYFPDYNYGLVVGPKTTGLTKIPPSVYSSIEVTETLNIQKAGGVTSLEVETKYKGGDADHQRQMFKGGDMEAIQKSYLGFYSESYPKIAVKKLMKTEDVREGANEFSVLEYYSLDSIWYNDPVSPGYIYIEFYPYSIKEYVFVTASPSRTMPYNIRFPVDFRHTSKISLKEGWDIASDNKVIESDAFKYSFTISSEGNILTIVHEYKTLKSYINADEVAAYLELHDQIKNNLSYIVNYNSSFVAKDFVFSWGAFIYSMLIIVFLFFCLRRIYFKYDVATAYSSQQAFRIGGWLILPAIGITLSPIRMFIEMCRSSEYWDSTIWAAVFDLQGTSAHMLSGILMVFELGYNTAYFALSIFVVILFYMRRSILPRFAILLYAAVVVFLILDTVLAMLINAGAFSQEEEREAYMDIIKSFIAAAIWIPYFLIADRVKQTFVFKTSKNQHMDYGFDNLDSTESSKEGESIESKELKS